MAHGPLINNTSEIKLTVTQLIDHYVDRHGLRRDVSVRKLYQKALDSHYFAEGVSVELEATVIECIECVVADTANLPDEFYRLLLFMLHLVVVYVEQHACLNVYLSSDQDSVGSMTTLVSARPTMGYLYITTAKEFTQRMLDLRDDLRHMACPCVFDFLERAHLTDCVFGEDSTEYVRFRETRANVFKCMNPPDLRTRVLNLDPLAEQAAGAPEPMLKRALNLMVGIIPNVMSDPRAYAALHTATAAMVVSRELERADAFSIACNRVGAGLVTLLGKDEADHIWSVYGESGSQLRKTVMRYAPNQLDYMDTHPPIADPLDRARSGCLSVINVLSGGISLCMHSCFTGALTLYSLIRRIIGTRVPVVLFVNSGAAIAHTSRYPLMVLIECTATELRAALVVTPGTSHSVPVCSEPEARSQCVYESYYQFFLPPSSTAGADFLIRSIDLLAGLEPCPNIPDAIVAAFQDLQRYLRDDILPVSLPFLKLDAPQFTFDLK